MFSGTRNGVVKPAVVAIAVADDVIDDIFFVVVVDALVDVVVVDALVDVVLQNILYAWTKCFCLQRG